MQAGTISLATIAWILFANVATACETPAKGGELPIETRRPVHGDDVRLSAGFGMRRHPLLEILRLHTGIDWAAPHGTPVIAAGPGRVVFAAVKGEYGNAVLIDHGGGWQTLSAQLSRFDVREGDCVASGALIGKVGSTGLSSGPHLHFEVQRDGVPIDPLSVRMKNEPPDTDDKK